MEISKFIPKDIALAIGKVASIAFLNWPLATHAQSYEQNHVVNCPPDQATLTIIGTRIKSLTATQLETGWTVDLSPYLQHLQSKEGFEFQYNGAIEVPVDYWSADLSSITKRLELTQGSTIQINAQARFPESKLYSNVFCRKSV